MTEPAATPEASVRQPAGPAVPPPGVQSLSEVHSSVSLPRNPSFWRRFIAFSGPAYLVSVGYMDPGNWATDIAAGARYGNALLWVLLMSNIMAVLLQGFSARLGIVTGMDLAQASRAMFGRRVGVLLWLLAEVAVTACDLAEILGSAIGLNLLFGLPLVYGVLLTALDTFLLLFLQRLGMRVMEAFILVLVGTIGACLGLEVLLSKPAWGSIAAGLVPSLPGDSALYLAIGILGATVMPHNLYLHSALVQSRRIHQSPAGIRSGLRFNLIDSVVALNAAFFVNAALLVMAAATFHASGHFDIAEIQDAHRLLQPILGDRLAPIAFAVALIAAGQSSTITGTLAGQIVMEGFVKMRLRPLVRRMLTRALALIPALVAILVFGEQSTGRLLVLSQVVLSLQLSFAVIPLIQLVSDRRWMGRNAVSWPVAAAGWLVAAIIAALNLQLAAETIIGWATNAGPWAWAVWLVAIPGAMGMVTLLGIVVVVPLVQRLRRVPTPAQSTVHGPTAMPELRPARRPKKLCAALDFSSADVPVLAHTLSLAREAGRAARVTLLHVVESGGARALGEELSDTEARIDHERLDLYAAELCEMGVDCHADLGFGDPALQLAELVERHSPDLLVCGGHGHGTLGDLLHGTTVERLRHRIRVPLLVVPVSADTTPEPPAPDEQPEAGATLSPLP